MGGTKQQQLPGGLARLDAVDRLRGLVMALMALDHTRGYFTNLPDPTNLEQTTPALFLTRWISHLCAPTFIFLAGTGAYLALRRGKTRRELAWFLLTRGLWVVLLGLTLVKFAWTFQLDFHNYNADVLWAIGWSMVVLAGLVFLPTWAVTAFGLVMIAGHNLLDPVRAADLGPFSDVWEILHRKEMYRKEGPLEFFGGTIKFSTQYPLIPWIGVMAVGYGFGALLLRPAPERRRWLLGLGTALCLGFVILRATDVYGDPDPWSRPRAVPALAASTVGLLGSPHGQGPLLAASALFPGRIRPRDGTFWVLSFLNCHKYPPSLLYLLMTLGPALLLLALFEWAPCLPGRPLLIFGRVPMFYYLIHIPLIHALMAAVAFARYGPSILPALFDGQPLPPDYGYSLPAAYGIWLGILLALYPACRWFADLKRRRRDAWLSYF